MALARALHVKAHAVVHQREAPALRLVAVGGRQALGLQRQPDLLLELGPLLAEDHLTWPARPDRAPIRAQRFLFAATITGGELGALEEEGTTDFARWVPMAALADQPLADIVMLALRALGR